MLRKDSAPRARRWMAGPLAAAFSVLVVPAAFAAGPDPSAGWHGRAIRDPQRAAVEVARRAWPQGWAAGAVRPGAGYSRPGGSRRVRDLQQRLRTRGYRPGPVDGRLGPRTRAALEWFQVKHGLRPTGSADLRTLATLRARPVAAPATPRPAAVNEPAATPTTAPTTAPAAGSSLVGIIAMIVILLGVVALLGDWVRGRRRVRDAQRRERTLERAQPRALAANGDRELARGAGPALLGRAPGPALTRRAGPVLARGERPILDGPASRSAAPGHRFVALPAPQERPPSRVLGYVLAPGPGLRTDAGEIAAWCARRGWALDQVVHDTEDRHGLEYALQRIADGEIAGLVCARLGDLAESVGELAALLRWFADGEAFLIALDDEWHPALAAVHVTRERRRD